LLDKEAFGGYDIAAMRIPITKYGLPQVVLFPVLTAGAMVAAGFVPIPLALKLPLELVLLDFSRTNYSSARASLGEARRMFRTWQRFAEVEFCMPWYRWQIARGVASGVLPADAAVFGARCQWPAWEYIDPLKEAQGNAVAISTATKSISECIRERGQEPAEVREELKRDVEWLREVGIALPTVHIKVEPENQSESEAA